MKIITTIMKSLVAGLAIVGCASCTACSSNNSTPDQTDTDKKTTEFANDDEFLDFLQKKHFNYMWDGAEATSGLACERIHLDNDYPQNDRNTITTGGSGFGVAGLIVAIDRGFITRDAGVKRLQKIVDYLAKADRYHGVWSHWMDGPTGKTIPFGTKDDGGDLVESSFLMTSLICVREYFKNGNEEEKKLAADIDTLWREMEYDWYTKGGEDVLYWHWSPNYAWEMNFPLEGYNECLITYVLAAASPTHSIPASAYHKGWARSGGIKSDVTFQGLPLGVKHNGAEATGGPLFWAHYSWIGLDPRDLKDEYADYWVVTRNHAMTDYLYCVANPKGYKGYGKDCWGLTASYSIDGYSAHAPNNDLGVITPTAALSSFPYTPEESMRAAKYFYAKGDWLMGKYGFYDAFSEQKNWVLPRYLAIDQLTIAPMIENYRSGLLWNLFMGAPEIKEGLTKLGFQSPKI
jgi:hypothetical protein